MNNVALLAVFIGGGLGSVLRFFITFFMTKVFPYPFPYGTLTANFLGCFTIGILMAIFTHKIDNQEIKLFFTTGMMGGLTTFSTFSYESVNLLKGDSFIKGISYISASLFGCLLLSFIGFRLSLFIMGNFKL